MHQRPLFVIQNQLLSHLEIILTEINLSKARAKELAIGKYIRKML
jgi:hypothetical protein